MTITVKGQQEFTTKHLEQTQKADTNNQAAIKIQKYARGFMARKAFESKTSVLTVNDRPELGFTQATNVEFIINPNDVENPVESFMVQNEQTGLMSNPEQVKSATIWQMFLDPLETKFQIKEIDKQIKSVKKQIMHAEANSCLSGMAALFGGSLDETSAQLQSIMENLETQKQNLEKKLNNVETCRNGLILTLGVALLGAVGYGIYSLVDDFFQDCVGAQQDWDSNDCSLRTAMFPAALACCAGIIGSCKNRY